MLSTLEPSADDPGTPRGLLRLGGRSIVHHQLDAALALGCEKVLCLAEGLPGELIALQHAAERQGAAFQVLADGAAVARAVRPDDDLLVFADGLVTSPDALSAVLGVRSGIVVQPVESGTAAGYERIDLNHAGGGVFRLPGRLVAGLADLPGEWNPVSALLRIAVQSSLRQVVLPQVLTGEGRWTLVRSDGEAHRLEPQWLRQHTAQGEDRGPGRWLAARLVERVGPALLHGGTRPVILVAAALTLALVALLAAWFDGFAVAFLLLGLAWLMRVCAAILGRVHGEAWPPALAWLRPDAATALALDGAVAATAAWQFAETAPGPAALAQGGFTALVLLGLLRLVARVFAGRRWAAWFSDRLVLALALAATSLSGVFDLALMLAVLGVLGFALIVASEDAGEGDAGESGDDSGGVGGTGGGTGGGNGRAANRLTRS